MASDIFDYLYWRGDLSFDDSEFNELDGAILARLSYLPFEKTDLFADENASVTIAEAAKTMLAMPDIGNLVLQKEDVRLLASLLRSPRYENAVLSNFVNKIDEETQTQFSAVTVRFRDGESYISFRGTDNTLVGWKEDFNMSFGEVPSQRLAAEYINGVGKSGDVLTVGGHSKGGNLAVYASAFADEDVQNRIKTVYNYDGPGFGDEVLASEGYGRIRDRVRTFVPQSSVVGMLLGHEEKYTIVYSAYVGIMQHDIYSWSVRRMGFSYVEEVDEGSKFVDKTLKSWISAMTKEQRESLVDALYDIVLKTDASTVREIGENPVESALKVLRSVKDLDETTREAVGRALLLLLKSTKNSFLSAERD